MCICVRLFDCTDPCGGRITGKVVTCMVKSDLMKKYALRAAWLVMVMVYIMFPFRVQAAEEGGMTQPSSAKIYSSMSENSDIIANLIVGNVFEVLEAQKDASGGIWYRVRTDFGAEGYVKAGEMDKLIMDAQAMMVSAAADTGGQEPESEGGNDGEELPPEDNNSGEEPSSDAGNGGEEPPSDARNGEEEPSPDAENGGEEPSPDAGNGGEEPSPDAGNAGEGPSLDGNNGGEEPSHDDNDGEPAPAENPIGEESAGAATVPPASDPDPDPVEGAGFGKIADSQGADSSTVGGMQFTVVERTEEKTHRHGGIDAVLMMIIAGGIICMIAIAALLKKIVKCVRTEA